MVRKSITIQITVQKTTGMLIQGCNLSYSASPHIYHSIIATPYCLILLYVVSTVAGILNCIFAARQCSNENIYGVLRFRA